MWCYSALHPPAQRTAITKTPGINGRPPVRAPRSVKMMPRKPVGILAVNVGYGSFQWSHDRLENATAASWSTGS